MMEARQLILKAEFYGSRDEVLGSVGEGYFVQNIADRP